MDQGVEARTHAPIALGVLMPGAVTDVFAVAAARSFVEWVADLERISGLERQATMTRIGRIYRASLEGKFASDDAEALALALVNGILSTRATS